MQINRAAGTMNFGNLNMDGSEHRPIPKGGNGHGIGDATSSLSTVQQEQASGLLSSFSLEQHEQPTLFLDGLKPNAADMTSADVGESCLAALEEIPEQKAAQKDALTDVFA